MPEKPTDKDEAVDGLELLRDPAPTPELATPIRIAPPRPPVRPARAAGQPLPPLQSAPDADGDPPLYRCLHCGYPIPEGGNLRCTECGRTYTKEALEHWFGGEEQQRFEHVLWMVVACLFLKLVIPLPYMLWFGRAGSALALGWACHLANRGRHGSTGGYYGLAGMFAAGVMFFVFSWATMPALAFHMLDMIGGCLLLLALLSDPFGRDVAGATLSKRVTPIILFATPVFVGVCWGLHGLVGGQFGKVTLPEWAPAPFGAVVPYLADAGLWLFVWLTLARMRRTLFGGTEQQT